MPGTDRPFRKVSGMDNKCPKPTWVPYPLPVVEVDAKQVAMLSPVTAGTTPLVSQQGSHRAP